MQNAIARRYLAYRFFTSMWFVGAVWLYFYRLFITDQQVGILDGMAFAIGLLAEVPSGALADKFGRDRIVRLGQILAGLGILIQMGSSNFSQIFFGQAVVMIGASFASGADEALFFQRLNYDRNSADWRKLLARGGQVALIGSVFALAAGGFLHQIDPKIPWLLNGLVFIVAAIAIWPIKDTRERKPNDSLLGESKKYLLDIKNGFKIFTTSKLNLYLPIIITVQGLFYAAGWGLLRLLFLDRFDFSPLLGSLAIASCSLITVGLLAYVHKNAETLSEKKVIVVISLSAAASLILALGNIGLWGYVVLLAMYAGEHVLHPFMSEVINNRAPEDQRATVLSVASFLRILPYVLLAPVLGYLSTNHKLEYFLISWAILIGIAVIIYLSLKKGDSKISLETEA